MGRRLHTVVMDDLHMYPRNGSDDINRNDIISVTFDEHEMKRVCCENIPVKKLNTLKIFN